MHNSLLLKLLGAFMLVIMIGGLVIGVSIWMSTRNAFSLYTSRIGQSWAMMLVPSLAEYYATNGNWSGVENILSSDFPVSMPMMGIDGQGNKGRGIGMGPASSRQPGQRILLADQAGTVLFDTSNLLTGQTLTANQLDNGVSIFVTNEPVGTLMITQDEGSQLERSAQLFLDSVNRSILLAALTASLIAIVLGIILFRGITAPLNRLKSAATAISNGDLTQRITTDSQDELGQLGDAFNRMADNLQKAENQRRHLIADVAHELRTPLSILQANLEGMIDGVIRMDRKHLAILHEETLLLNRLISDLRLLSVAEAGELVLDMHSIDPSSFLPKMLDKVQPAALEKKIRLEYQQESRLPKVLMDPDRVTQVVMNLIANAMNFTPQGGLITLSARPEGGMVKVSICDTGFGIPPEEIQHIFDRFYRVDKSRARKTGGSGLGLAIVKQLVDAHGGKISVVSPVQADPKYPGTCISFTLPASKT
jgi:signal transduction histidine kinase